MFINKIEVKDLSYSLIVFFWCLLLEMNIGKISNIRIEFIIYLFLLCGYLVLYFLKHKLKLDLNLSFIGWAGTLYLIFIALSSFWSVDSTSSIQYSIIFVLSLIGISTRKRKDFHCIIQNFIFLLFILSVLSWLYYFLFGHLALSDKDVAWRLKGVLGHEQRLAIFMSIGIILLFLEKLKVGSKFPAYYYVLFFATLFATQARAFILFTIMVVSLMYIIEGKKHTKLIFFFLAVITMFALASSLDMITDRFSRGDADLTLTGRVPIWEFTLYRVEERPLLGFGFASFMKEGVTLQMFKSYVPPHAHNTVVHSLFEVGIIGTVFLLHWMFKLATNVFQDGRSYSFYLIILAFLCGLMGIIFGTKMNGCLLMVLFLISIENESSGRRYKRRIRE